MLSEVSGIRTRPACPAAEIADGILQACQLISGFE
jgi:hypothetical protein